MLLWVFFSTAIIFAEYSRGEVTLIEGDIVLDQHVADVVSGRGGVRYDAMSQRKWPDAIIPYVFDAKLDALRINVVDEAIAEYNKHTCIRFVPRSNQRNYVRFVRSAGCWSSVGMRGRGRQDISLGTGCEHKGIAMHEMMHAAGFFHEQSRLDRDNHVIIYWDNIKKGMEFNFQKYDHGEADTLGEPYDLDSLMHYSKYSFSIDRKQPTIVAKSDPDRTLGQRNGFSPIDLRQLNKLYNCKGKPMPTLNPPKPSSEGPTTQLTHGPTKPSSPAKTTEGVTTKPSGCVDLIDGCLYWKKRGMCQRADFKDYLKKNCCKSCSS